jgi:hypothetical protein
MVARTVASTVQLDLNFALVIALAMVVVLSLGLVAVLCVILRYRPTIGHHALRIIGRAVGSLVGLLRYLLY